MAGKFNIRSETPEIAGILPSLIFLLIKMSPNVKVSPRSLHPIPHSSKPTIPEDWHGPPAGLHVCCRVP